jgi:hypothetical protein
MNNDEKINGNLHQYISKLRQIDDLGSQITACVIGEYLRKQLFEENNLNIND